VLLVHEHKLQQCMFLLEGVCVYFANKPTSYQGADQAHKFGGGAISVIYRSQLSFSELYKIMVKKVLL